jgi:hypothetical protein
MTFTENTPLLAKPRFVCSWLSALIISVLGKSVDILRTCDEK